MKLTRRSAIALMGTATSLAAAGKYEIEPGIIQRHDESVEDALKSQITDRSRRGYGNLPHLDERSRDLGIYPAGTAAGLLEAFTAAYLHPSSRFHGNRLLIERMRLAAGFLNRSQHEDGLHRLSGHQLRFRSRYRVYRLVCRHGCLSGSTSSAARTGRTQRSLFCARRQRG